MPRTLWPVNLEHAGPFLLRRQTCNPAAALRMTNSVVERFYEEIHFAFGFGAGTSSGFSLLCGDAGEFDLCRASREGRAAIERRQGQTAGIHDGRWLGSDGTGKNIERRDCQAEGQPPDTQAVYRE